MTPAPVKPPIALADLQKIDVRVGTIRSLTPVLAVPEAPVPEGTRAG